VAPKLANYEVRQIMVALKLQRHMALYDRTCAPQTKPDGWG